MSETAFKVSDVVELASGSLPMTVIWVEDSHGTMTAYCQWAERTKNGQAVKGEEFPVAVLRHVEPKSKVKIGELKPGYP